MAAEHAHEARPLLPPAASLNADPAPPAHVVQLPGEMVIKARCYFPRRWILMMLVAFGGAPP